MHFRARVCGRGLGARALSAGAASFFQAEKGGSPVRWVPKCPQVSVRFGKFWGLDSRSDGAKGAGWRLLNVDSKMRRCGSGRVLSPNRPHSEVEGAGGDKVCRRDGLAPGLVGTGGEAGLTPAPLGGGGVPTGTGPGRADLPLLRCIPRL